jgi:biotin carboxylase
MKVVVYSTGSSYGMIRNVKSFTAVPTMNEQWKRIRSHYADYEFTIVTTKGYGSHLVDYDNNKQEIAPEGVKLIILDPSSDTDAYVEAIRKQAPSIAIATSYFGGAVDWETLKDALIAEELRQVGIRAVSNSLFAAETFFDKWNTHRVLTEKGFPVAKATHIPAVYQKLSKENPALFSNVYLDLAFHRIRQMQFPVIVKSAGASGSSGIFVASDFEKAKENILSRDDSADLIVEEMLKGEQFGTEIHGTKGNYTILPPFKFNLNDEGIIETREKIKYGPITDERYRIEELRSMLRRLAEEMGIEGCAQVDLAFDGNEWSIIEVNPRLSGMTSASAALESRYALEVCIESCLDKKINYDVPEILEKCISFGARLQSLDDVKGLEKEKHMKYMEKGSPDFSLYGRPDLVVYGANITLGGFASFSDMADELKRLAGLYPNVISERIIAYAEKIAEEESGSEKEE